ncbi:hypothetical protein EK21DRAFT_98443 [Setomelanomma holmii]|uniref:Heterokaryon incompatibility domain-containing protein n=1 Tax=Setomelanomma holmii TaxID=210430 RepID=A0A9P4LRU5_9PLEO|nr:hypothetical protein EK21DRAFT_98443 [Setomelanomma holmii]
MRLINVDTLQLSESFGDNIPRYAILSHRWGKDEVDFEMFSYSLAKAKGMLGFKKIGYCAKQSSKDGLQWCWADTCCIDKRSSSELSEAIKSMYQWYQSAAVCYAYLEDITVPSLENDKHMFSSDWFSRGWTLQELIAPRKLHFYSKNWSKLGGKGKYTQLISSVLGIDVGVLLGHLPVERVSIGQRM